MCSGRENPRLVIGCARPLVDPGGNTTRKEAGMRASDRLSGVFLMDFGCLSE